MPLFKGERRLKDGLTPFPESSKLEVLDEDMDDLDQYFPEPEEEWRPNKSEANWLDSTSATHATRSASSGASFPRGRAPKNLAVGLRTRNLDVGLRIGRKAGHGAGQDMEEPGAKKTSAMEEQMKRIENRKEADTQLQASKDALEKAKWERGLDSIPWLPGRWTEKMHVGVIDCLNECRDALDRADRLYTIAAAKDKIPEIEALRAQLIAAQLHATNTRLAWLVLGDAEHALQEAAALGWPHGRAQFEQADTLVTKAREYLLEIGEAGSDEMGRLRLREKMLSKRSYRVLTVRKECERRRSKVQVLLLRLAHAKWEVRYEAMLEMAEIGRLPVPCKVTFLGELVALVDEHEWQTASGRGDSEVVAGILNMMHDKESEVRRVVVEALPRVCKNGDPLVLESISRLTADTTNKVKCNAMDALAHMCQRGDNMVTHNLAEMLEELLKDPDTTVRALGVELLPLVTLQPEDNFAIDQTLLRLDHKRRTAEHPHWITEERDVRLAALKALTAIAPHGHDRVIRRVCNLLRSSWQLLVREYTGCARDPEAPHKGSREDYGACRGPLSLTAQLRAIEREAASNCPAKCGEAAAAVRIAAIEVLVAVCVKRADLAYQREQLISAASSSDWKRGTSLLGRGPTMGRNRYMPSGGSDSEDGSKSGSATGSGVQSGAMTPGKFTPGKYTPSSFSRTASSRNKEEREMRLQAKAAHDKAFGDIVRYTTVVECLCERLCDMDRQVRWASAQALVQQVAVIDDIIVVEALAKCLEHSESEVQHLAIQLIKGSALGVCVTPGNPEMTDAICKRFACSRRATRAAACEALMAHCTAGDEHAVYFLIPQLWHEDSLVRQDALVTLKRLVPKGNGAVLQRIEGGAFSADPSMRIMAIYALSELADSDDNVTAALLEDLLLDQHDAVVCAATCAVANMAPRGHAHAIDLLLTNCHDMSEAVRRVSIQALTRLSDKGDAAVIETALKLIDDVDVSVRKQALETLTLVSDKGNTKVCAKIIARLSGSSLQGGEAIKAIADLRGLRWSSSRSLSFTFGSVGPPGTTHSAAFEWSQSRGMEVKDEAPFRMPAGIPVTDGAQVRSKTWGSNFARVETAATGGWEEEPKLVSVTWHPTTLGETTLGETARAPWTGHSLAEVMGYADAPVHTRPPTNAVLNMPFAVRPLTAPTTGPPLVFRVASELEAGSRPGTQQSARLGSCSAVSKLARSLFAPALVIDTDGGYDSIFGLVLLACAGVVPQLVTTVHGMGEAVSSAITIKRLYATLQSPYVAVVPSVDAALVRGKDGRLCMSRPGSSLVRLDGSTRRVPSRFGPDYRRHLAEVADRLFLTPLGVSHEALLQPPGLTLRIANLERDLRLLSMVAGAKVSDLEDELHALAQGLDDLNRRGRDYYAEQGRGLSRDGRAPSSATAHFSLQAASDLLYRASDLLYAGETAGDTRVSWAADRDGDGRFEAEAIKTRGATTTNKATPSLGKQRGGLEEEDVLPGNSRRVSRTNSSYPEVRSPYSEVKGILRPVSRASATPQILDSIRQHTSADVSRRQQTSRASATPQILDRNGVTSPARAGQSGGGAGTERHGSGGGTVSTASKSARRLPRRESRDRRRRRTLRKGSLLRRTALAKEGGEGEQELESAVREKEAWEVTPPPTAGSGDYWGASLADGRAALGVTAATAATCLTGSTAAAAASPRARARSHTVAAPSHLHPHSHSRYAAHTAATTAVSNGTQDAPAWSRQAHNSPSPPASPDARVLVNNRAVAALVSELAAHADKSVTLLQLGCMTNLAAALEADPELVHRKIKNVVVMGGATRVSPSAWHDHAYYTQGGAEFNFYFDSQASYAVVHSGLEIVVIGLEVANADVCPPEALEKLISAQMSKKSGVSTPAWLLRALMLSFDMSVSYAAVAAFYRVHPECFMLERAWVQVDAHSGKLSEVVAGTQCSVPVMLATELRKDKYLAFLLALLTDDALLDTPTPASLSQPTTAASKKPKSLQERRIAKSSQPVLTWAGREPVARDSIKTSGSKILRLESVATSVYTPIR